MRVGEIKKRIIKMFSLPPQRRRPIFIWGPPGVGKSSIVRQVHKELGIDFVDLRLGLLEPVDLRGVPFLKNNHNGERTVFWARPTFIPSDGEGILFLDEFNVAVPAVQAAAYQLLLDRRVGEHKLGDGWYIVAAGNRETDAAVVYRMPTPNKSRLLHFELEVNVEDWTQWALQNGIHEAVIGFVNYRKDLLLNFDPKSKEKTFPCPRTWEFTSDLLQLGFDDHETIASAVGIGAATEFLAFYELRDKMPDIDGIISGKVTSLPQYEDKIKLSIQHAIVAAVSARLVEMKKDRVSVIDNVLEFAMNNFDAEFVVLQVKQLSSVMRTDVMNSKKFFDFSRKYNEVII